MSTLVRLGDRMLARLVPKITARAEVSWTEICYCRCGIDRASSTPVCYKYIRRCYSDSGCSSCFKSGRCG
jgi:hypothetical protein